MGRPRSILYDPRRPNQEPIPAGCRTGLHGGSQPAHRGVEVAGKGLGRRKEYDAAGMLKLHLEGCTWREVGRAFGVCAGTARDVVMEEFPHRVKRRGEFKVKPASQIVLRNQSDADKTGRIQGTGVQA